MRRRYLLFELIATIVVLTACGENGNTSVSPTAPTTVMPGPQLWTREGIRLDNGLAGYSGVLADTSTIQLTDGRWRMYVFTGGQVRSAISSDGLSFSMEPGSRLPEGYGQPRVIRLSDERLRIFASGVGGIRSAISQDDGMTFSREDGTRVNASSFGLTDLTGPSNIVRTYDGRWRMYFSDLPRPGQTFMAHSIYSASSSDLLNWHPDSGARIGPGAELTGSGEHPAAISNSDGSVSIFYFRNDTFKLMAATSNDGLTFATESDTGLSSQGDQANDPDLVRISGGMVRMYYNEGNEMGGRVRSAVHSGTPPW